MITKISNNTTNFQGVHFKPKSKMDSSVVMNFEKNTDIKYCEYEVLIEKVKNPSSIISKLLNFLKKTFLSNSKNSAKPELRELYRVQAGEKIIFDENGDPQLAGEKSDIFVVTNPINIAVQNFKLSESLVDKKRTQSDKKETNIIYTDTNENQIFKFLNILKDIRTKKTCTEEDEKNIDNICKSSIFPSLYYRRMTLFISIFETFPNIPYNVTRKITDFLSHSLDLCFFNDFCLSRNDDQPSSPTKIRTFLGNRDLSVFSSLITHLNTGKTHDKITTIKNAMTIESEIYKFLYDNSENLKDDEFTSRLVEYLAKITKIISDCTYKPDDCLEKLTMQYYKDGKHLKEQPNIIKNIFENRAENPYIDKHRLVDGVINYERVNYTDEEKIFLIFQSLNSDLPTIPEADKILEQFFSKPVKILYSLYERVEESKDFDFQKLTPEQKKFVFRMYESLLQYSKIAKNFKPENELSKNDLSLFPMVIKNLKYFDDRQKQSFLNDIYGFLYDNRHTLKNDSFTSALKEYIDKIRESIKSVDDSQLITLTKFYMKDKFFNSQEPADIVKYVFKNSQNNPAYAEMILWKDIENLDIERAINVLKAHWMKSSLINEHKKFLLGIADIYRTEENSEQYSKMVELLKRFQDINYDIKDEYGVSFLEKVLNSENFELLDLIKDKKLNYHPELDTVFAQIENEDFKNKAKNLKLSFPDLMEGIRIGSPEVINLLVSQIKSPFFNESAQQDLAKYLAQMKPSIRNYFCTRYEEYLPKFFKSMVEIYADRH